MRGNLFRNRNSPDAFLCGLPEELSLSMVGQTDSQMECPTRTEGYVSSNPACVLLSEKT